MKLNTSFGFWLFEFMLIIMPLKDIKEFTGPGTDNCLTFGGSDGLESNTLFAETNFIGFITAALTSFLVCKKETRMKLCLFYGKIGNALFMTTRKSLSYCIGYPIPFCIFLHLLSARYQHIWRLMIWKRQRQYLPYPKWSSYFVFILSCSDWCHS